MAKVLVLYYSSYGHIEQMAHAAAEGAKAAGATVDVKRVPETVPAEVAQKMGFKLDQKAPLAAPEELANYDAIIFGTPTRFGNMAAPLKHFLDGTGALWLNGALDRKPAAVFTSTTTLHGGQETTLLTMMLPLLHHGMMLVGLPYTAEALHRTTTGGSPYGASQVSGGGRQGELSGDERELAQLLGRRLATAAKALKSTRG